MDMVGDMFGICQGLFWYLLTQCFEHVFEGHAPVKCLYVLACSSLNTRKINTCQLCSCLIMTFHHTRITTCKIGRVIPLDVLYLPIHTRTCNEGVRILLFSPEVFKERFLTSITCSAYFFFGGLPPDRWPGYYPVDGHRNGVQRQHWPQKTTSGSGMPQSEHDHAYVRIYYYYHLLSTDITTRTRRRLNKQINI